MLVFGGCFCVLVFRVGAAVEICFVSEDLDFLNSTCHVLWLHDVAPASRSIPIESYKP